MDALKIGFVVISAPRLFAAIGLASLVLVAEVVAARRGRALADAGWAWNAAFATLIGARMGFVLENLGYYRQEPLQALAFWQGGFAPWWGVVVGALVALWSLRRGRQSFSVAALPVAVALSAWLIVPQLLSPAAGAQVVFPAGQLGRLDGTTVEFAADAPTIVNLWASWCVPCRREMPQLARAAAENPAVRVLYVNQGESAEAVAAFLANYPDVDVSNVLLDRSQQVGNALGSVGLPTTYFFDASGAHVKTHVGEISGPALAREIRTLTASGSVRE